VRKTTLIGSNAFTNNSLNHNVFPKHSSFKGLASERLDNDWRQLLTINYSDLAFDALTLLRFSAWQSWKANTLPWRV